MAASELSELRAELWRTRDDLERMKARGTPPSAGRSPRLLFDRRHPDPPSVVAPRDARKANRSDRDRWREAHDVSSKGSDLGGGGRIGGRGEGGEGIRSGPTSPPTSGDSSRGSDAGGNRDGRRLGTRSGDGSSSGGGGGGGDDDDDEVVARTPSGRLRASPSRRSPRRRRSPGSRDRYPGEDNGDPAAAAAAAAARGSSEEIASAAEETLCNLALEGAAFKNWTEEASSIAVRLIEEVKALRWEKAGWADRERAAENAAGLAAAELRARADRLEERLRSAEADGRRSQDALARAQQAVERERARAQAERAKADGLRSEAAVAVAAAAAAQKDVERVQRQMEEAAGGGRGGGGLVEMLRREKEGADALQRRLDAARASAAKHEREKKEWRSSRARLEELRRSWGKQLKKIEKKMRLMAKENASLRARVGEAERARDRADADALHHRDALRRLTEQRDNLLLGASRLSGGRNLSASSPAETLAELLAAAAAVAVGGGGEGRKTAAAEAAAAEAAEELEAQLEQARSEAKLARVAAQQERLRRDAAAREKDEAVRQLHRLQSAARRAVDRRDSRLRSSRMETEVVWNALTEAVR